MIQVKNIVKSFEGVTVLNDISADFRKDCAHEDDAGFVPCG